jgi:hypothetical protein
MLATTSSLLTLAHTSVWNMDPYDAIPHALDQAETALNEGEYAKANTTLKTLQLEYGGNEAFALFAERYQQVKQQTLKMISPVPNLSEKLDEIEAALLRDPIEAKAMLKTLQSEHGLTAEFSDVIDRYNELKNRIASSTQNPAAFNRSEAAKDLPQNILKNNVNHTIIDNVNSIRDVLPSVKENTLAIFDVDDTLIGQRWSTNTRIPLENNIMQTLRAIYNAGGHVIALTSRGPDSDTKAHLEEAGIYLDQFSLRKFNPAGDLQNGLGYADGIFYASNKPKGEFIAQIVKMYKDAYSLKPERIIFIDDIKENVEGVIHATRLLSIDSVGIVYTGAAKLTQENHHYIQNMS